MLKLVKDEATAWTRDLFNKLMDQGMPKEWTENWIKSIRKAGERSIPNNYRTIMVGSTMAKIFETMMESKLSSWAKEKSK